MNTPLDKLKRKQFHKETSELLKPFWNQSIEVNRLIIRAYGISAKERPFYVIADRLSQLRLAASFMNTGKDFCAAIDLLFDEAIKLGKLLDSPYGF